ncbi:MAG TPA: VWA domain-containing protein [Polyangiaceae bacterium]|nr:VWA domain-containing protein [Polyangiaceae bacterium]
MLCRRISAFSSLALAAPVLWGIAVGCSAAGGKASDGDAPGGSGGPGGLLGNDPSAPGGGGDLFGSEADSVGCSQLEIGFEAQTPTALIIVDRSSSQWDSYPNHSWEPMKQGIIQVVGGVQQDIRVGVVTYTGQNGGACPDLFPAMNMVSFDKNNLPAIESALNTIDRPPYKGETPTAATIQAALPVLLADPSPGEKVMLLVTDGDPDFCNDPDRVCAMDAVIGAVQAAYAQGVSTAVFGLRRAELSEQHLRDVANAGSGQPVALPPGINSEEDLRNRCRSNPPGSLTGTYSATGGNAQYYQANGTDQAALGAALDAVIYGIRSCIFELDGAVEINRDRVGGARITIDDGAPLVYGDANGWTLRTETQVELLGSSCQQIKNPATGGIKFDFPCDVFVPR